MPTHRIIPYSFRLREKGDTSNYWDLANLRDDDDTLPMDDIIDAIHYQFQEYSYNPDRDKDLEKTFWVEDFARQDNIIEAIVRTGDYGYEALLRDVETNETDTKEETQAEELPFYVVFVRPRTPRGAPYEGGEVAYAALQQVNGRGVKTMLYSQLQQLITKDAEETVMEMNPVMTGEVLDKLASADRVLEAEFEYKKTAADDDLRYQVMEGMDSLRGGTEAFKLKSPWGGSLDGLKEKARQLKGSDRSFGEIVKDDIEDLTVEIEKDGGGQERFSLLDDELAMRKQLDPHHTQLDGGLPKRNYIARESRKLINDVLDDDTGQDIPTSTHL